MSALSPRQKLSLYESKPTELFLMDTPSELETHLGTVRRTATGQYRQAHDQVQGLVSRWIGVEQKVEHRVKSLLAPDERLVPGALYAGIAFLSGAILARRRALPTRALLPSLLGTAAFVHFLPRTSANVRTYASEVENKHFPKLAERHEMVKVQGAKLQASVGEGAEHIRAGVKGGVFSAVAQVQGATGLRLMEALGVAREAKGAEERIVDVNSVADEVKADEATKERTV
ncbi:apolipo protein O-domain-containing protein [Mycena vitilis]|nr:apolipo protein O-domain-containing protein [Mycena vitilis]